MNCFFRVVLLVITLNIATASVVFATTNQTVTTGAGANGTTQWNNPTNAQGTTDDNVYATTDLLLLGATATGNWSTYQFDSVIPTDAEIVKVEILPQYKVTSILSAAELRVQAVVDGTACPTSPIVFTDEPTTDTDVTADVTSCRSWTRTDLLNSHFGTRITAYPGPLITAITFSLDYVKARVTYDTPTFTQAAYRFFANTNSADVGTPLAATNTTAALASHGDAFRLRLLIHQQDAPLGQSLHNFKLQYVDKGSGTCASPSGGTPAAYTDVTDSTLIAYNNNAAVADGTLPTTNAQDPTYNSDTIRRQSYEEANNFTNSQSVVAEGESGLWDFSLIDNGALGNTSYCFRVIESDGTVLSSYAAYPQVTPAGQLAVDLVDADGESVSSPSIAMSAATVATTCKTTIGTLGTSNQKIRVQNTTANAQWSASIAPVDGAAALWQSGGSPTYDINDPSGSTPGCVDGGDADVIAGQLTINPTTGTITPTGCTATGVSLGSQTAFSQGVIDAITLFSASGSAATNCIWDVTGIGLSQQIPSEQPPETYQIDFMISVIAL